jgi:hypothetical protein
MGLAFRNGLHVCLADGHVALFDEKGDMYFGLEAPQALVVRRLLETGDIPPEHTAPLQTLLDEGVLVSTEDTGFTTAATSLAAPVESALHRPDRSAPLRLVARAALQHVWTAMLIHRVPLHTSLVRLRDRKARSPRHPLSPDNPYLTAFLATHRLISTQDQCLRSSIALTHFLLDGGCCPSLVIGVRFRPFGAHAWVQTEGWVLNDTVDHVKPYTPILVI